MGIGYKGLYEYQSILSFNVGPSSAFGLAGLSCCAVCTAATPSLHPVTRTSLGLRLAATPRQCRMGAGRKRGGAEGCLALPAGLAGTGPSGSFFECPEWVDQEKPPGQTSQAH